MFQQLVPLLRQRSVLLTLTSLEDDQIRVNVIPKKLKEGENTALTTPMSFTGTAVELGEQLPDAIVSFVASHLALKHSLARAKEEMDAAAKAAQEEARNKAKNNKKPANGPAKTAEPAAKEEPKNEPEPPRLRGLFDTAVDAKPSLATSVASAPTATAPVNASDNDDEEEATSWRRSRTGTTMKTPVMKKQTKPHNCGVVVSPALLEGLRSVACGAVHAIAQRQRSASGAASGKGGDSRHSRLDDQGELTHDTG